MQIPLSHFEQYIEETILKRGLSYFRKGQVSSFEALNSGEFGAIVQGTEEYMVKLKIRNNYVTECFCSCPYDYGPVCKHIVAVFFYMQQEELNLQPSGTKKSLKNKPVNKRKTVSEQVDEVLDELSPDDLKKFIKEQCMNEPGFRRTFLSGFLYKTSSESPEKYREQVRNILKSAKGRNSFIDWSHAGMVGKSVNAILGIATKHLSSGNFMSALHISFSVAEEMVKALEFADDSNGDIGGGVECAFDIIGTISKSEIPEDIRTYLFDQSLMHYRKKNFSGWDWHTYLLDIAVQLVKTEKEAGIVLSFLHGHAHSEFENEQMTNLEYELIKKMKGDIAADKFIEKNLDNPDLRRKAIAKAIKNKDFEKAKSLSNEGIRMDEDDKPGLALEWYDWLLRIALAEKDKIKIIEYARYLFVDGFRHDQDYYRILKQHIEPGNWTTFIEEVINNITKNDRGANIHKIAAIYIAEEWWNELLEIVSKSGHLQYLQHYDQYLSVKYPSELAGLYEKGIIDFLKHSTGRDHYKEACRYMRRMIKLGARDRVNNLVSTLHKEYPQRKALMDELSKI